MKCSLTLLTLAVGSLAPLTANADPAPQTAVPHTHHSRLRINTVVSPAQKNLPRRVYYITNNTVTGSNIPVVYRRYHGHNEPIDSGMRQYDVLTAGDIGITGATDVSGALFSTETALTPGNGHGGGGRR